MDSKIETFIPGSVRNLLETVAAQRPVGLVGSGLSKGDYTKRQILDAAFELFIDVPAEKFTMRNLAAKVGMRLGNLTYHYSTRSDLIESMVRDRLAFYAQEIGSLFQTVEASPRDALEKTITLLVHDLRQPEIAFFPKLWALALDDPQIAALKDEIHDAERQVIAGLIGATRPDWNGVTCDALALHITATIEGLTLFIGQDRRNTGIYKAPEKEIIRTLRLILQLGDGRP